jgi:transposase
MVRVPTLAEEDAKRPNRERECLVKERTRLVNRMKGALARLGIRNFRPTLRKAAEHLAALYTPEGLDPRRVPYSHCALIGFGDHSLPARTDRHARDPAAWNLKNRHGRAVTRHVPQPRGPIQGSCHHPQTVQGDCHALEKRAVTYEGRKDGHRA